MLRPGFFRFDARCVLDDNGRQAGLWLCIPQAVQVPIWCEASQNSYLAFTSRPSTVQERQEELKHQQRLPGRRFAELAAPNGTQRLQYEDCLH